MSGDTQDISMETESVDTALISANINSGGNYNLESATNYDAKGLQALDYLLHQPSLNDQQHVDYFNNQLSESWQNVLYWLLVSLIEFLNVFWQLQNVALLLLNNFVINCSVSI